MAIEPVQQFENLLLQSKNVLVFLPQNPDGDAISAGWAFNFFLKEKGIETILAFSDEFGNAKKLHFLPHPENITNKISGARDFVLAFNTKYNKIINVRKEATEEELRIFITPDHGSIDPRDFSFIPAKYKFDLVVVLGSPDKESIGRLYEENPDIFYEVPVVNIDCHSANDNFGQINIVRLTASSVCEILAETLEKFNSFSIGKEIAECLLAGIMSATESFQNKRTTPKALEIAASLMDKGADQQKIVRYLYKTQPFHLLKLWGRVMSRLKWNEQLRLVWAQVFLEDFVQSRSNPGELPFILEKIKGNYSEGKIFLALYNESEDVLTGVIKCDNPADANKIASLFDGKILQDIITFKMTRGDIDEAEKEILEKLKTANIG